VSIVTAVVLGVGLAAAAVGITTVVGGVAAAPFSLVYGAMLRR